jgi:hypothetical protein
MLANGNKMICLTAAKRLVAKANMLYDSMLTEGNWLPLVLARQRACSSQNCSDLSPGNTCNDLSPEDVCVCVVAECRNPVPFVDIPNYRHLIEVAEADADIINIRQFLVAVHQEMFKIPTFSMLI